MDKKLSNSVVASDLFNEASKQDFRIHREQCDIDSLDGSKEEEIKDGFNVDPINIKLKGEYSFRLGGCWTVSSGEIRRLPCKTFAKNLTIFAEAWVSPTRCYFTCIELYFDCCIFVCH